MAGTTDRGVCTFGEEKADKGLEGNDISASLLVVHALALDDRGLPLTSTAERHCW